MLDADCHSARDVLEPWLSADVDEINALSAQREGIAGCMYVNPALRGETGLRVTVAVVVVLSAPRLRCSGLDCG